MAKLTSPFVIKGKFAGGTAYVTKDGNIFRTNGTLDKQRLANAPEFAMLRNNNSEFAVSASSGKAVRNSLKSCARDMSGDATYSLTRYMRALCNKSTLERGRRLPANINYDAKKVSLFKRKIAEVCRKNVDVTISAGSVAVSLNPVVSDLIPPAVRLSPNSILVYRVGATVGIFDLETLKSEEISAPTGPYVPVTSVGIFNETINISGVAVTGDCVQVATFIEFAEQLNGFTYPVAGGRFYDLDGGLAL